MNSKKEKKIIETENLPFDSDFYWDLAMGGLLTSGLIWSIIILTFLQFDIEIEFKYPLLIGISILVVWNYIREQKLRVIETKLTKQQNQELLKITFQNLQWKYELNSTRLLWKQDKYMQLWTGAYIFPVDNKILYRFQYGSSSLHGRFSFFLGIRTYYERKFKNELITTYNNS